MLSLSAFSMLLSEKKGTDHDVRGSSGCGFAAAVLVPILFNPNASVQGYLTNV